MYAIVEFRRGNNKEYAVVPIIWLVEHNTECYWPPIKTEKDLEKLVKQNTTIR